MCTKYDVKFFNFNTLKLSLKFASNIYNGKITLGELKKNQYEIFKQLKDLEKCNPKNFDKIKSRDKKH